MSQVQLLQQDARQVPVRDVSVHLVVTSPPYYSLRDYGESNQIGLEKQHDCLGWATGNRCGNQCYICVMVAVFTECYRILRNDGVMFVIVGDSYAGYHGNKQVADMDAPSNKPGYIENMRDSSLVKSGRLKPKDLCGIPQRLALALQAAGWTWRSEIIWSKGNAFPESVTDRPTKSHEQILMFTKQARYFWNQEAVREPYQETTGGVIIGRGVHGSSQARGNDLSNSGGYPQTQTGRNLRDVWHLNSEPTSHAHYATFPTELVSRCIRAGSPETCCGSCGKGWQRVVERETSDWQRRKESGEPIRYGLASAASYGIGNFKPRQQLSSTLEPACSCSPDPVPSLVYDPFLGSGTTVLVARQLRRHGIGGDLSAAYLAIARERLGLKALAAWEGRAQVAPEPVLVDGLPLFQGL